MIRILVCCTALALGAGWASAQTGLKPPASKSKPKPASAAPKPAAQEEENLGVKAVERIFACLADGLPEDWKRAWVVVTELSTDGKERSFEGKFFYSLQADGSTPLELKPCNAREVGERVHALNDFLEPAQRQWKVATLIFTRDGKFDLKYDYSQ